jgi:hypothetical protein|nr:MAG TPA: hypothetical protein [Caudoviricetes sp.]
MISPKLKTDTLWILDDAIKCPFPLKEKIKEYLDATHGDSILSLSINDDDNLVLVLMELQQNIKSLIILLQKQKSIR